MPTKKIQKVTKPQRTRHYFSPWKETKKHNSRKCLNCGIVEKRFATGGERNGLKLEFSKGGVVVAEGSFNVKRPRCEPRGA